MGWNHQPTRHFLVVHLFAFGVVDISETCWNLAEPAMVWKSPAYLSSAFNDLKMRVVWTDLNHQQPVWFKSDRRSTLEFSTRPYRNVRNMLSRRGLMVLCLACAASADDTACALQKALSKPTIRDNYVYFYAYDPTSFSPPPVQSVQFDETSHSITQGQPYEGVFTLGYYLDVRAGRHESEEVAHDFNAGLTPDNAWGLHTWPDTPLPSELNFAVFGNMSVTIDNTTKVCLDMRIAQGHTPAENNWWIAGTTCHRQNRESLCESGLTCPCGDSNVTFHPCGTDHDFNVEFD